MLSYCNIPEAWIVTFTLVPRGTLVAEAETDTLIGQPTEVPLPQRSVIQVAAAEALGV
jgi:hypothetical protein